MKKELVRELVKANKDEKQDMRMDELVTLWKVRHEEFGIELIKREETNCCGSQRLKQKLS